MDPDGSVPAPDLREVAEVWWDVDDVPLVAWHDGGRRFVLTHPDAPEDLHLATFATPPSDPRAVAAALAHGIAACDFPPTGDGAAPGRVAAALRVARQPEPDG